MIHLIAIHREKKKILNHSTHIRYLYEWREIRGERGGEKRGGKLEGEERS